MTTISIRRYTHDDDELWTLAGRWFADAKIRQGLGRSMTSAPGFMWWLAIDGVQVVGIAALSPKPHGRAELRHAYVLPSYRGRGIYRALLNARIEYAHGLYDQLLTVSTEASRHALEKTGFVTYSWRGRYAQMALDLT